MAFKALKFRLYPNAEQRVFLEKTFGCCRKIWNLMLEDKIACFQATGELLQNHPAQYKGQYPFLKEVDSSALSYVQMHLQSAFRGFFREPKKGFPQFKSSKRSKKSFTTNRISLLNREIKLAKAGAVKARIHRRPDPDWRLRSATITREADGTYYASILFQIPLQDNKGRTVKASDRAIGLDFKLNGLFMDSNGNTGSEHKFFAESQRKISKLRRRLSRKTKGGKNYEKQKRKTAKQHRHIANQRKDHLHKLSTEIANRFEIVCVENLSLKEIANTRFGLGKSTLDNGYGMFVKMLEYKQKDRGHILVKVGKWYPSSKTCSACGRKITLSLSERSFRCECGHIMDRDHNAAINIRNEGLRLLGATV